ncbi:hypothetical protein [Halapricum desulfuricans]|uniref:hypothetical protein n=1 Tax=Halapricum desulfuricans TaxID=2841257 RepID=UPI001E2C207E|nr:hypothetical protein [Halapricum desulfuricans]
MNNSTNNIGIVREITAIAVTIVYIAGAYIWYKDLVVAASLAGAGAVMSGIAGGFIALLVLRPGLFDDISDENNTRFSPTLERVGLTMGLLTGLVGFGGIIIASFI